MNIFFLDDDPVKCAEYHCDKHVVKMIVEYAQLLSTAHRVLDGEIVDKISEKGRKSKYYLLPNDESCYKATHVNHPSAVWVRKSFHNYRWLYKLFIALLDEYTFRYNKIHATSRLSSFLKTPPRNIASEYYTEPPKCMPEELFLIDTVSSYRNFYKISKRRFASWQIRKTPEWFNDAL